MCRSADRDDGGAFVLGAEEDALKSGVDEDFPEDDAVLVDVVEAMLPLSSEPSPGFAPGSLILDLENIFSSSYINHGVNWCAANADLVVQMRSS